MTEKKMFAEFVIGGSLRRLISDDFVRLLIKVEEETGQRVLLPKSLDRLNLQVRELGTLELKTDENVHIEINDIGMLKYSSMRVNQLFQE